MDRDVIIKKLLYQSWHRGCKETDFILGKFSKEYIESFSNEELTQYEQLISENDWDIFNWLINKEPFPKKHQNRVTDLLKDFDCSK